MKDHDAEARAEVFWRCAGSTEAFPRSLEAYISRALPLAIVKLPRLWLAEVHRWLAERGIKFECRGANRSLRACLLARGGYGLIFVNGSDTASERRLSLAHEVAHFLCDYLDPRRRVQEALGEEILAVLDGDRAPTIAEQIDGILRGVALGTYSHLMERTVSGTVTQTAVLEAEDRADRLALELIAPRRVVLARLASRGIKWREAEAFTVAEALLVEDFGLPRSVAKRYGQLLVMGCRRPRSFSEWLRT